MAVEFEALQTRETDWQPRDCKITLNCCLEARAVPASNDPSQFRLDTANLVVVDNFFGESERRGLLSALTDSSTPEGSDPGRLWERNTADDIHASKTWGLRPERLQDILRQPSEAVLEIHSRLVAMYPEYTIAHMPSHLMQASEHLVPAATTDQATSPELELRGSQESETPDGQARGVTGDCCNLLANAPVHGDHYEYHADVDPMTLPDSVWRREYGDFPNREPGKPLLVSLLLYLVDDSWDLDWHGETIFLDTYLDVGICVRPRRYRAVLMDQDVYHRVVAPSRLADRPRYSLVWKLAFLPNYKAQVNSIARPEWGSPTRFASAAKIKHTDEEKDSPSRKRQK